MTIVGGYAGQLSSTGDGIQLQRPGAAGADGFIPRLLEDEVIYDNLAPWPSDGLAGGRSLNRTAANAYGNDAASWTAAAASPGSYGGNVVGDLSNDGRVDGQDVDLLHEAVRNGDAAGDLDGNGLTNVDDLIYLVENVIGTSIGDVNFDGVFDSNDLIRLFQFNEFEDGIAGNSVYSDGDWDLNGEFDSQDLLFALDRMGYQTGTPPAAVAAAIAADATPPNDPPQIRRQTVVSVEVPAKQPSVDTATRDLIFKDFDSALSDVEGKSDSGGWELLAEDAERLGV